MLIKIEEPIRAEQARELAAAFAELANTAASAERREMFLRLRDGWLLLANDLQSQQLNDVGKIRIKRARAGIVENVH